MKDYIDPKHYRHRELPKPKKCGCCKKPTTNKEGFCDYCLFRAAEDLRNQKNE